MAAKQLPKEQGNGKPIFDTPKGIEKLANIPIIFITSKQEAAYLRTALLDLLENNKEVKDPERLAGFLTNWFITMAKAEGTRFFYFDLSLDGKDAAHERFMQKNEEALRKSGAMRICQKIDMSWAKDVSIGENGSVATGNAILQTIAELGVFSVDGKLVWSFADFEKKPPLELTELKDLLLPMTGIDVFTLAAHETAGFQDKSKTEGPQS